jgi:hypothetical protein
MVYLEQKEKEIDMRKNLENRLAALGYKLLPKFYAWSQWKIIVGPEYPTFIKFCDNLKEVQEFVEMEEILVGLTR